MPGNGTPSWGLEELGTKTGGACLGKGVGDNCLGPGNRTTSPARLMSKKQAGRLGQERCRQARLSGRMGRGIWHKPSHPTVRSPNHQPKCPDRISPSNKVVLPTACLFWVWGGGCQPLGLRRLRLGSLGMVLFLGMGKLNWGVWYMSN